MSLPLLLLITGFVAAALVAVLDVTAVNWWLFALPLLLGFTGVFWHRRNLHTAASHGSHVHGSLNTLEQSLRSIDEDLRSMLQQPQSLPTYEARFSIDRLFRQDLFAFADARESMQHAFGIQAYADIMSAFAAGERYLNRVWSASADGYVDEVNAYLHKASEQFSEALELFLQQRQQSSSSEAQAASAQPG